MTMIDSDELQEIVQEARLPLKAINTPYDCPVCEAVLCNFCAYHNECESCGNKLSFNDKKAITTYIGNLPWRTVCG